MALPVDDATISAAGSAERPRRAGDPGIDLARLRLPLTPDDPCGPSLRYEGAYDAIQAARRADDPGLPQGVWQAELKQADWPAVARLCREALEGRSKDLQLGAWLLEALIHLDGFAGAARGLEGLAALVADLWDDLHPRIEDGDLEPRLAPLEWVAAKLPLALRAVPLNPETALDPNRYGLGAWIEATFIEHRARREPALLAEAEAEGRPTRAAIQRAIEAMPAALRAGLLADLGDAMAALDGLAARLEERCGALAPRLTALREELEAAERLLSGGMPAAVGSPASWPAAPEPEAAAIAAGPPSPPQAPAVAAIAGIESREQAYAVLDQVADFLLRVEPHSPAPYLVKRAVAWSRMSLADLLADFIRQDGNLERFLYLLGLDDGRTP